MRSTQAALCYVISRHRETNTVCSYFSVVSNVVRVTKIKSKRTITRDMIMAKEKLRASKKKVPLERANSCDLLHSLVTTSYYKRLWVFLTTKKY